MLQREVVIRFSIPRRLSRRWLFAGVVIAMAFGVAVYAKITAFKAGDQLSSQAMNDNFTDLDNRLKVLEQQKRPMFMGKQSSVFLDASYCGNTAATAGAFGGYLGAQALCKQACNGSSTAHMCTAYEMTRFIQTGGVVAKNAVLMDYGWIAGGVASMYNTNPLLDCRGYTSAQPGERGVSWYIAGNASYPNPSGCESQYPILCCD